MTHRWRLVFGIFGLFVSSPTWADRDTARYSSVTVFGDSLVDAGNYYAATGGVQPPGVPPPYPYPALGYFEGRLTNGYNYPDLLSQDLFGKPTTPSLLGGSNFAFAAARIVANGDPIPDIQAQLGLWKASGQAVDPDGLYILNFGANDVFAALGVFGDEIADPLPYLQGAAQQYSAAVAALNDAGVRNILLTDFPLAGNPFTAAANGYLNAALAGLTLDQDTDLFMFSISDFNQQVLTNPSAFGLPALRSDTNCIAENAQTTGCAGIFSFDGVHPTAAIQAAGYRDLNERFGLTASVPEPATWAMMLVGFAMIGGFMRRKQRWPANLSSGHSSASSLPA